MKRIILTLSLLLIAIQAHAATGLSQVLVTNINALDFKVNIDVTNAVTNVVKMNLSRSQFQAPVVPGDVWTLTNISGVYGGSTNIITNSIWGIDGSGHITPIVTNNAVIATNIVRAGHGVNTGSETWQTKSIVLTNGVNYLPVADWSQLQLISPSSDPSLVQIVLSNGWNTVQHLEIFNITNAVPSQGAFTLTNLTPIPDSLGGGVVKLINNENWVATNGCGIELRFISPDWVEQFRSDVSGNPTFISNTFNNITVISNTTLRGRITINNVSITTNTLWTTNVVAGVVNLQPVDLTEQPMVKNGWFVGTNSQTLWGSALGSDWALVSVADATKGEGGRGLSIASTDGNFSTNYSQITLSTVTNTAGLTLLSSDGSNDSVVSLQSQQATGGGGVLDIKFGGTNFVHIEPGITNGSPIAQFGSSITHSTGNLFELANNTTNRVVVTPLSTLIGSPVTSPNFSVPAALQVSNFEDRGKALTVDIKLGASGNNDDYPVYFYSQITNSSAHPTINMEEVSPSGYIGGAHTLLSVQETPKVTNTVSTWPTYAAASTTAGYFNAAPTGGTNGAAMGLQGSVDPTRNFINIGVGSYVEATTDNLAATNIAFSGTVNQVLGTQKAVGGLFEIGSLANIPTIPSSAGVLIDGHNSGAPLIIAQTNGAVQMKVNANSGYDGTGNLVLTSDGTYKTLSSLGGGGNMTNSGAAVVGMVPVATDTSGGNWTPTNALNLNALQVKGSPVLSLTNYFGGSAHFVAANSNYLSCASSTNLQAQVMTLTAWCYIDAMSGGSGNMVIAAKDDNVTTAGSEYWLGVVKSNTNIYFQIEGTSTRVAASTYFQPAYIAPYRTWIFVVGMYDGTNVMVQVDNDITNSTAMVGSPHATSTPFSIGADVNTNGVSGSWFNGRIDSVGLWSRVLTASERTTLYNAGHGVRYSDLTASIKTNLTSWWDLDEFTGTRADSFSTNNLADSNGVGLTPPVALNPTVNTTTATATNAGPLVVLENAAPNSIRLTPTGTSINGGNTTGAAYGLIVGTTTGSAGVGAVTTDFAIGSAGSAIRMGPGATTGNTYSVIDALTSGATVYGTLTLQQGNSGKVGIGTTAPTSGLHIANSFAHSFASGSAFTLTDTNEVYFVTTDAQLVSVPTAVGHKGRVYTVKTVSPASTATLTNVVGTQTFDGALSYSLSASNKYVTIISDNVNWWIIGNN